MSVQLSPAKPAEDHNGLEALADELMKADVAEPVVVVGVLARTKRVLGDSDSEDSDYPVLRWARIEPVLEGDREAAVAMADAALAARSGKAALEMPAEEGAEG